MQNLLKNKLLIILSIFILLIGITSSCFATSNDVVYFHNDYINKDITFKLPSGYGTDYQYYAFFTNVGSNGSFYQTFLFSDSPFYFKDGIVSVLDGHSLYYQYYYNSTLTTFDFSDTSIFDLTESPNRLYSSIIQAVWSVSFGFNFSNHTIYKAPSESEVVFQGAPLDKVELMQAIPVEEIPQQIKGILAILLPMFLTIFGMLLLVFLIKSKNLLHL